MHCVEVQVEVAARSVEAQSKSSGGLCQSAELRCIQLRGKLLQGTKDGACFSHGHLMIVLVELFDCNGVEWVQHGRKRKRLKEKIGR